jgi:uncharacterized membrane protein (DUF441 family)
MTQAVATLVAIALLSITSKDRMLMAAAVVLAVLAAIDSRPAFVLLQKHSFQTGIFFLLLFLLLPVANQKISVAEMGRQLLSVEGAAAVVAGLAVSVIGGRGVQVLAGHPAILTGVVIGTLIAVLFFQGLPAGLIIAAGLLGVLCLSPA